MNSPSNSLGRWLILGLVASGLTSGCARTVSLAEQEELVKRCRESQQAIQKQVEDSEKVRQAAVQLKLPGVGEKLASAREKMNAAHERLGQALDKVPPDTVMTSAQMQALIDVLQEVNDELKTLVTVRLEALRKVAEELKLRKKKDPAAA